MSQEQSDRNTEPKPLTAEQLADQLRPSEQCLSPDGALVAYRTQTAGFPAGKEVEHATATLWVVPFAGGESRRFTSGQWNDAEPQWSPDSTRLAFLSDRAERGKSSLYVIPRDGGEALRVFEQQGDLSKPHWSPDGRYLAVLFTDPETDEEKEKKEAKDDAKVWGADYKYQRLWVIDVQEQCAKAVSPEQRQVLTYAWSLDGDRLAINTSATPLLDDIFGETLVQVVPRDGGAARDVFCQVGAVDNLVWSPDGQWLAYQGRAGQVVHGEHVFKIPVAGGAPVELTPNLDGTVYDIVAGGDGNLLAHIVYGVNGDLRRLSWDGELTQTLRQEPWGAFYGAPSVNAAGDRFAVLWEDGEHQLDVWAYDIAAQKRCRLTHLNPELEQAAIGTTEIVRWESDPGVEVEGILIKPHGYVEGMRYPLIVQPHGGPTAHWGNEFYASWHDWGRYLAGRGFAVLMHNPRGSTGRGSAYMNGIFNDVGGGEFRDLMSGVDAMIERGLADPDALGVAGWSWGGYMTAWTVSQTTRFKAAVMGAGLANMISDNSGGDIPSANASYFDKLPYEDADAYHERSAIRYAGDITTPLLILHGEADSRVNMHQALEMYQALRLLGREYQFVTYPREGHSIRERKHQLDLLTRLGEWFEKYLQPETGRA